MNIEFDGQQQGENILYEIRPHTFMETIAFAKSVITALFCLFIILVLGSQSDQQGTVYVGGILAVAILLAGGLWWNKLYFRDTKTYLTDRRVMRFERVSPLMVSKRALFWNEVLKAKAYEPNLLLQSRKIGTLIVEPQVPGGENIIVHHVHYADDMANYIDKILYTFKNAPADISSIRPFVPKPRGHRDEISS